MNKIEHFEDIILHSLLNNKEYLKKVLPFLEKYYFEDFEDQNLFRVIKKYYSKYRKLTPISVIIIHFTEKDKKITQKQLEAIKDRLNYLENVKKEEYSIEWLLENTESWCKDRAMFNAIVEASDIYDNRPKDHFLIPDLVQKPLQICFDRNVGHDYFKDTEERFNFYHSVEEKYETHLEALNRITDGGLARKTLNVIGGPPGGGKSRMMVDLGANYIRKGLNVLYISLELSEMMVAQRFDANILDVDMNDIPRLDKDRFMGKIRNVKSKTYGKLIIKNYPTAGANVNHFRRLMEEIKDKRGLEIDVVIVDYLTIVLPVRQTNGNMYANGKNIAEELRGFFIEYNVIGITGCQLSKEVWGSSDVSMKDVRESSAICDTSDFMIGIAGNEELLEENRIVLNTMKNRLNELTGLRKFIIGFNDRKMKHYDVNEDFQDRGTSNTVSKNSKLSGGGNKNIGNDFIFT